MQCPVCEATLTPVDRSGIEIDVCTRCRGVWLDRGELEKLIERAGAAPQPPVVDRGYAPRVEEEPIRRHHDDDDDDDHGRDPRRRRRGGFLGDLFDF